MSQADLAKASGLSLRTIQNFEGAERPLSPEALAAIERAFEAAGVFLIDENGGGAGARLKKRKAKR